MNFEAVESEHTTGGHERYAEHMTKCETRWTSLQGWPQPGVATAISRSGEDAFQQRCRQGLSDCPRQPWQSRIEQRAVPGSLSGFLRLLARRARCQQRNDRKPAWQLPSWRACTLTGLGLPALGTIEQMSHLRNQQRSCLCCVLHML